EHDADLGVQVDLHQRSDWLPICVHWARIVALNTALLRGLCASNRALEHQNGGDRSHGLHDWLLSIHVFNLIGILESRRAAKGMRTGAHCIIRIPTVWHRNGGVFGWLRRLSEEEP